MRGLIDPVIDLINRAPRTVVIGALVWWLAPGLLGGVLGGAVQRRRRRRR